MMFNPLAIAAPHAETSVPIFFAQLALLIIVGRLLGEAMQRVRQPAVMGQLLAGIVLGPSVLGTLWPTAQQFIFPMHSADRQMLNAVSELGILMLLLLTGMETDLALVKRVRTTAAITSGAGIVIPFVLGYGLGSVLPADILPDPSRRFLTSLFLATALSISSVKIVAAVLREVDFLKRNLGQVILAAAILDDTIGWTILALISGLASNGGVKVEPLAVSIIGTGLFFLFSFTIGSRIVARIIRWTNDHFVSEMSVISVILVIMLAMALLTNAIGVHTVLGAFVSGIIIGQSPILTKHIEEELRGLIVALFMPVFFGIAGLSVDLKVLTDPHLLKLALLFIAIASVGKLGGCYLGSRLARLNHPEALAVGFAMNARGSTEIILATVGLRMGVLNQQIFTIIVIMAMVTTVCMPPLLRWALARAPMRDDEKQRLEKQASEENDIMPKLERVLVGLDASENGRLASRLAGWFIGTRNLTTTVVDVSLPHETPAEDVLAAAENAKTAVESAKPKETSGDHPMETAAKASDEENTPVRELVSVLPSPPENDSADAILAEAKNGYGLLFLGLGPEKKAGPSGLSPTVEKILREFKGPVVVPLQKNGETAEILRSILLPVTGADFSRFGAEVAMAIAKGCGATITALHVSSPPSETELLRHSNKLLRAGRAVLNDIAELGEREGVRVRTKSVISPAKPGAILSQAESGRHQLIVFGTSAGNRLHFGESATAFILHAPCPILIANL